MVSKKYTKEQIIAVLKEAEAGTKLPDLCRKCEAFCGIPYHGESWAECCLLAG